MSFKKVITFVRAVPRNFFIGLIWVYKYTVSPFFPATCRFTPSCSEYGIGAFKKHGLFKGFLLTVRRIGKCHPWGGSGYDPVP